MQKAIIVEREGSSGKRKMDSLLKEGWVVEKMSSFHPSVSVASGGSTYSSLEKHDKGAILVILENLGVDE